MMIRTFALNLTNRLVNKTIIKQSSHEVYTYGFELIISAFISIFLMAILSISLRRPYDWLLFLSSFVPLRTTAGGYHASTHLKCIVIGSLAFFGLLVVSRLPLDWTVIVPVISVISFLLILLFSPVEARNKSLKVEQRKRNRIVSISFGSANLLFAVSGIFIQGLSDVLSIYFAGVFAAALSMLVANAKK